MVIRQIDFNKEDLFEYLTRNDMYVIAKALVVYKVSDFITTWSAETLCRELEKGEVFLLLIQEKKDGI